MSRLMLFLIISFQVFTPAYCPFESNDTVIYTIEGKEKSENFNSNRTGFFEFQVSDNNGTHVFFQERKLETRQGYSYGKLYYEKVDLVTYETIRIKTRQNKFGLYAWHWINPSDCFLNATIQVFAQDFVVINSTFLSRINKTVWFLNYEIIYQEENFEEISRIIAAYEYTFGYLAYYQVSWQRNFQTIKQEIDRWYSTYTLWFNSTNAKFSLEQPHLFPILLTGSIIVILSACTSVILIYYAKRKRKRGLIEAIPQL
ncbi:MAG: hypothetical protein ACFFC7_09535 [Candidatus Hermodarchaeota archaeon]